MEEKQIVLVQVTPADTGLLVRKGSLNKILEKKEGEKFCQSQQYREGRKIVPI